MIAFVKLIYLWEGAWHSPHLTSEGSLLRVNSLLPAHGSQGSSTGCQAPYPLSHLTSPMAGIFLTHSLILTKNLMRFRRWIPQWCTQVPAGTWDWPVHRGPAGTWDWPVYPRSCSPCPHALSSCLHLVLGKTCYDQRVCLLRESTPESFKNKNKPSISCRVPMVTHLTFPKGLLAFLGHHHDSEACTLRI